MRKIFAPILFGILISGSPLTGQSPLNMAGLHPSADSLIEMVLRHNPTLAAAQQMMEASKLEARTGNTPPDPVVEMGWLSGFPESLGNRLDFSVAQEFDFPTAYIQRARAKDIRVQEAELAYALTRQEVLARASALWIERVSLDELHRIYQQRLKTAAQLSEHYRRMVEEGEVGKLSYSQANLQMVSLQGEMEQIRSALQVNEEALLEITNGNMVEVPTLQLPSLQLPQANDIYAAWADGPEMMLHARQVELREQQGKLAVSKALPSFSAGYYSEAVINERFRGVSVGISIPLWEDANTVKHARARISQAEAELLEFKRQQQMELAQLMAQWNGLEQRISELSAALSEVNDEALLSVALELGEISLSEYIFSSDYYFQNMRKLIEMKRDQLLIGNALMKVGY
jgi:outer membrane protein TolC